MSRLFKLALAFVFVISTLAVGSVVVTAEPAKADSCYTWGRTLREGHSGSDVRQLQIRLSGYPGYGSVLSLDGDFGPRTREALKRFQRAYGLSVDGIAGSQTYNKLYYLQDGDCTPRNFSYSELNRCNSSWTGGAVSASQAKFNALVSMWKLQAMRKALGSDPIRVTSGFRSYSCNSAVGGAPNSRHLYGDAVDLGTGYNTLCQMARNARYRGFRGILGPGYSGHNDHVHVSNRSSRYWSAPNCGI